MTILLMLDQAELDQMNTYFDAITPGWLVESYSTPIELLSYYPMKSYCVIKSNIDYLIHKWTLDNILDPGFITFVDSLITQEFNSPIWKSTSIYIPSRSILELAPIGSWSFVLEGSSTPVGNYMTQATKAAIPSNLTPAILPANLHVVSMTWINETNGANEAIHIYLNGALIHTWDLPNCRWAITNALTDIDPILTLPERGKISTAIVNQSLPAAKDGILTIYFRMVGQATGGQYISPTLS